MKTTEAIKKLRQKFPQIVADQRRLYSMPDEAGPVSKADMDAAYPDERKYREVVVKNVGTSDMTLSVEGTTSRDQAEDDYNRSVCKPYEGFGYIATTDPAPSGNTGFGLNALSANTYIGSAPHYFYSSREKEVNENHINVNLEALAEELTKNEIALKFPNQELSQDERDEIYDRNYDLIFKHKI